MFPSRFEEAPSLVRAERAALEERVRSLGDLRRLGKDLGDCEVEVRVSVVELRWDGVCGENTRHTAGCANGPQGSELGVVVEAIAGLPFERRRARVQHPVTMASNRLMQTVLARRTRRANRRHDPAAARVQLLVARARGSERELLDAVAGEAHVRVAVDQARDRAPPAPVELLDFAARIHELAHASYRLDAAVEAEDIGVLDHVHVAERRTAQRRSVRYLRRGDLGEVADQEPAPTGPFVRHPRGRPGSSSP